MAKEHVHALKGLVQPQAWLRLARLPPPASRLRRSRRLRDTLAAAPGLLAHASITEVVNFCRVGPKLRHTVLLQDRLVDAERRANDAETVAASSRPDGDFQDELFALERHVRDRDAKITLLQVRY